LLGCRGRAALSTTGTTHSDISITARHIAILLSIAAEMVAALLLSVIIEL